jgi:hypothetical protein
MDYKHSVTADEIRDYVVKGFGYPMARLKDAPRIGVTTAETFEEVRAHILKHGSTIQDLIVVVPQSVHEVRAGSTAWCAWMLIVTGTEPPITILRLVSAARMARRTPLIVVTPYYKLAEAMYEANVNTFPPVRE